MVSRNPEGKSMPLSKELIKSFFETEEEQSVMILTLLDPNHFRKELKHSKPEVADSLWLFKYQYDHIKEVL